MNTSYGNMMALNPMGAPNMMGSPMSMVPGGQIPMNMGQMNSMTNNRGVPPPPIAGSLPPTMPGNQPIPPPNRANIIPQNQQPQMQNNINTNNNMNNMNGNIPNIPNMPNNGMQYSNNPNNMPNMMGTRQPNMQPYMSNIPTMPTMPNISSVPNMGNMGNMGNVPNMPNIPSMPSGMPAGQYRMAGNMPMGMQPMSPFSPGSSIGAFAQIQDPLSYIVQDESCIKFTHSSIPSTQSLLNSNYQGLPFGFTCQPLAPCEENQSLEKTVKQKDLKINIAHYANQQHPGYPLVNFRNDFGIDPPRCNTCKGYISCYNQFLKEGSTMKCCLCGQTQDIESRYFCNINPQTGLRADVLSRPELTYEAYEVDPPRQYSSRHDNEPEANNIYFFLVDISPIALASGLTSSSCKAILEFIKKAQETDEASMAGIVFFDTQVHMCAFRGNGKTEILTVPEIDSVFIPTPRDIVVSLRARGAAVISLLECACEKRFNLKSYRSAVPVSEDALSPDSNTDLAFGTALQAAAKCLNKVGGKIIYFISHLPSCGEGALHVNFNGKNDKSKTKDKKGNQSVPIQIMSPPNTASLDTAFVSGASSTTLERLSAGYSTTEKPKKEPGICVKEALSTYHSFYTEIASKSAYMYISIDGFVAPSVSSKNPSGFCDVATLGELSRCTSGHVNYYPTFSPNRDFQRMNKDLMRILDRTTGLESCARIRFSPNLAIHYYGHYCMRRGELLHFGCADEDTSLGGELTISENLEDKNSIYLQLSFLFTAKGGKRRVRVVTKKLPSCGSNVEKFIAGINPQTAAVLAAKKVAAAMRATSLIDAPSVVMPAKVFIHARCSNDVGAKNFYTIGSVDALGQTDQDMLQIVEKEIRDYNISGNVSGSFSSTEPYQHMCANLYASVGIFCKQYLQSVSNFNPQAMIGGYSVPMGPNNGFPATPGTAGINVANTAYNLDHQVFTAVNIQAKKLKEFTTLFFGIIKSSLMRPLDNLVPIDERANMMLLLEGGSYNTVLEALYPLCINVANVEDLNSSNEQNEETAQNDKTELKMETDVEGDITKTEKDNTEGVEQINKGLNAIKENYDNSMRLHKIYIEKLKPKASRAYRGSLSPQSITILSDQFAIYVYVGGSVSKEELVELTGMQNPDISVPMSLSKTTKLGKKINTIIDAIRYEKRTYLPVFVVSQQSRFTMPIAQGLIDERIGGMSFADFIQVVGAIIYNKK